MINSIHQTAAALTAKENKLAASSHNVANINTQGYKKLETSIVSGKGGAPQIHTTVSKEEDPLTVDISDQAVELSRRSNVSYVEETVDQSITRRGYEADVKMLQTTDEMTGTSIDIVS